jgi:acyl-CoA synthetase (AMP-forming)/AMP-acid ligase II
MGLNNGIIQPLFGGRACVLMAPQAFLQRPRRWLQAVSDYQATISGAPNFAYEMCVNRITPEQRVTLDLSSWKVAYSGAEPIRAETLKRFADAFAPSGFRENAFYPCYGLAEATLMVSGGLVADKPILCATGAEALEQHHVAGPVAGNSLTRTLVGCGRPVDASKIRIVNPETSTACGPDQVGEIWVSGANVSAGYWNRPVETALSFQAYLAEHGEGPFLRTGDLGFVRSGELFVTGRLKDLIIIGGRNLYPHDLERTIEDSHPALQRGCSIAFSTEVAGEECLIVAAELDRRHQPQANPGDSYADGAARERSPLDLQAVTRAIRRAVAEEHDVRVHAVMFLRAGEIPKTPSGKLQRRVCEARFRDGTLAPAAGVN